MTRWLELGDGVFARRYAELDLSVGLVVGGERCLVIDTRSDPSQGAELVAAVREVTPLPWTVVITHDHFDHCLGTSAFLPASVWAHPRCRDSLAAGGQRQFDEARTWYAQEGLPEPPRVDPVVPDRTVTARTSIPLGGRMLEVRHPGPGHTDHDLVVWVPDAGVLFAGDLVEQGAPPDFTDAVPSAWPAALDALLELSPEVVVPGHGAVVDAGFVAAQRDELAVVARLCTAGLSEAEAEARSPYDERTTRLALAAHQRRSRH